MAQDGSLFDELIWRGLVHDVSEGLPDTLAAGPLTLYYGIDPTADSLHVGHLLGLVALLRFANAGHKPIALVGGGTGLVGDPSGASSERVLLSPEEVKANVEGIRAQVERLVDVDRTHVEVVDNSDWLWPMGLMDFLRDVGKHFTVNAMIAKESVRARLEEREQGISYTEFSYGLLQAYDFLRLFDSHECRLQIGGSEQWGNITMGVDLIRRKRGGAAHALTWPLITLPGGEKMGKSAGNAVWLDAKRDSPYQLYQFFIRADDSLVGWYLRAYTFLAREEIEALDLATTERPQDREAQRALAWEVTSFVHGTEEAAKSRRASEVLFTEAITSLDEQTLLDVFADAPSSDRPRTDLDGLLLVDALVAAGLVPSKSAARTTITQGGAYVNNRRVSDAEACITAADLLADRYVVLRKGRKDQHLLRFG